MGNEIGSLTKQRHGSGPASWAEGRWYQRDVGFYPAEKEEFGDISKLITEHIVRGHAPDRPILTESDNVVTLGSCFAAELRFFLAEARLSADSFWVPSGLNNTFALLDFISWCVRGEQTSRGYRYDRATDGRVEEWQPEEERERYVNHIRTAGAIVMTLGLAEVWEDRETKQVFWRGIPESIFDEQRHCFRVTTTEENTRNLERIISLIRKVNPAVPIVITLSPVPLKATFRDISCMTADSVSKSILRVSIDSVMQRGIAGVYYWPSFEVVKWAGCHLPYPVYGTDDGVVRHVSRYIVRSILSEFIRSYYGEKTIARVKSDWSTSLAEQEGSTGEPPILYKGVVVKA